MIKCCECNREASETLAIVFYRAVNEEVEKASGLYCEDCIDDI